MRHLGLVIGVNQYQDSLFCPLQFAENDSRALAQWLVNAKGGKWSPPNVQVAQGQHITRQLVESLLTQICITGAEPDDIILLYFAGHAFIDEKSGDGYLAFANTQYQQASSGLSLKTLTQQFMMRSRAAQILCILDCFQTGQVWNMRRTSPYDSKPLLGQSVLSILQQQQNRLFLCSCRGNQSVSESSERQLGIFVHRLILGLCGPARESSTGNITLPKLHAFLFNKLGEQHRPQLFGQQNPPLVLVGTPNLVAMQQAATATASVGSVPSMAGSGLLRMQPTPQAPPSSPLSSPEPATSGHLLSSALEDHRQQQCQQLIAQAQQLLQNQNYGPAFDLVEQALHIVPNDVEALTLKAQLFGTAGRLPEALAIIEQLLQRETENALLWSMHAVVLGNVGQYQQALVSIERSLELDAQNPETYSIKTTIMENLAAERAQNPMAGNAPFNQRAFAQEPPAKENARSFFLSIGLTLLGLLAGLGGSAILFKSPPLPSIAGLFVASFGLALLCVNAARGAFRYGFSRFILALLTALLVGGTLGAAYQLAHERILASLGQHLLAIAFTLAWLIAAATLPLVLAFFALIIRLFKRTSK